MLIRYDLWFDWWSIFRCVFLLCKYFAVCTCTQEKRGGWHWFPQNTKLITIMSSDNYIVSRFSWTCVKQRLKIIWKNITGNSLSEALIFASTHNMTTDCSLNYKFNTWKFQAQTWGEHVAYRNCFWHSEQFLYTTCSPHVKKKEELLTKIYLYGWYLNWMNYLKSIGRKHMKAKKHFSKRT